MLKIDEINKFILEDASSSKKRYAKTCKAYYEGEHDILQYTMFYYNADGNVVKDETRTNMKIPHPFYTELIDQCVQYMMSGKDSYIKSDNPALQSKLDEYFNDDFKSELQDVITGAKSTGFSYMYAYTREDGKIAFQHADALDVVECREKETDDGCKYVIYYYQDRITKENRTITRIQVWDANETWFYVKDENGEIALDKDEEINPRPHVLWRKPNDDAMYYDGFGFIPFFRLDNNTKQTGDLKPIKALIDDYDLMSCGLSNNLVDFDQPVHIVKGFDGDSLDELQQNLKTKKIIGVGEAGGVEVQTVNIPYQARQVKMAEDEKNIYRFGMGFNSAQMGDGNVTNVVIRSRYALLDLKCNKLETRLKQFLSKLVEVVLKQINENSDTSYTMEDVWFDFQREVMTNATDNAQIELVTAQRKQVQITTLLGLNNVLPSETIIQQVCNILELDYEEVKDKIADANSLGRAQEALNNVTPEE